MRLSHGMLHKVTTKQ